MALAASNRLAREPKRLAALVTLFVAGGTSAAASQPTFTLGSPSAEVRRVQGVPAVIERLPSLGVEIWTFGAASVRFSSDSLRVIGWEDAARTLRVAMRPGPNVTSAPAFDAGSHRDDVVRLMGTPAGVREDRARGTMLWRYGPSGVTIGLADGRVLSYANAGGNLRVEPPAGTATLARDSHAARAVARTGADAPGASPATPNAPLSLDVALSFREPSGNRALDGGEAGSVAVAVRNRGPGIARGVRVRMVPDSGESSITIGTPAALARLDPGASASVDVPITASIDSRDGRATLRLIVTEANGFDVDVARRLTIPLRATRPPRLALAGVRADDQSGDGRVSARELIEVTARVWNAGTGAARDVKASLTTGEDAFLIAESARELTLGTMVAGDHRDITFVFYTNTRARDVRVVVALHEATGRYGATLTLPFAVDRPTPRTLDDVVAESPTDSAVARPASLPDEVERDIPRAAEPNPDAIAVIIGVERYAALPPARFAARDAQLVRRYAASLLGVPDDRNHIYLRTDADATGSEFRKLFGDDGWLARRVRPTTDLYVYFSGHGAPDLKTRTAYLLPADADASYPRETGYALATLYRQLARLNARSVTVMLDACFTGATRTSGTLYAGARPIVISVEHPALLKENFTVLAAAGGDQIASDYPAKRHGLFTYFALLGLKGAADTDGDRAVTVAELERYLGERVPGVAASLDREQVPLVIARRKDRPVVSFEGAP